MFPFLLHGTLCILRYDFIPCQAPERNSTSEAAEQLFLKTQLLACKAFLYSWRRFIFTGKKGFVLKISLTQRNGQLSLLHGPTRDGTNIYTFLHKVTPFSQSILFLVQHCQGLLLFALVLMQSAFVCMRRVLFYIHCNAMQSNRTYETQTFGICFVNKQTFERLLKTITLERTPNELWKDAYLTECTQCNSQYMHTYIFMWWEEWVQNMPFLLSTFYKLKSNGEHQSW